MSTAYIDTPSLHDALPILPSVSGLPVHGGGRSAHASRHDVVAAPTGLPAAARAGQRTRGGRARPHPCRGAEGGGRARDRKSTRLNSSHVSISYAVFCLTKK